MKRFMVSAGLLIIGAALSALAAEPQYQQATILNIEQKTNTRVLYYIVNTPITKDEPYFDVSLQLKDVVYTARYTPRHKDDELPDDWKAGSTVQARVHGRHLDLKGPGGNEVELVILKRKASPAEEERQGGPANK